MTNWARKFYQSRVFWGMFLATVILHCCRKNFDFVRPILEKNFQFSLFELGLISAAFSLLYALGKFLAGFYIINCSVKKALAFCLLGTGILNCLFPFFPFLADSCYATHIHLFNLIICMLLWGINGAMQAPSTAASAKGLVQWFWPSKRFFVWGVYTSSALIGFYLIGSSIRIFLHWNLWQLAFIAPGIVSLIYAIAVLWLLPEFRSKKRKNSSATTNHSSKPQFSTRGVWLKVITNKSIWCLSCTLALIYYMYFCIFSWGTLFLTQDKHFGLSTAIAILSVVPFAGILGTLFTGWLIDMLPARQKFKIFIIQLLILSLFVLYLWKSTPSFFPTSILLSLFCACIVSLRDLLGGNQCAILVSTQEVPVAIGFSSLFSYVGAILADLIIGIVVPSYGWKALYISILAAIFIALLLLVRLDFLTSQSQHNKFDKLNTAKN